ncbi:MAG: hypothetical protein AAFP86_02460, partial [Planctomycetota bacterium]
MKNHCHSPLFIALAATASFAAAQEGAVEGQGRALTAPDVAQTLPLRGVQPSQPAGGAVAGIPGEVTPDGAVFERRMPRTLRNEAVRTAAVSDAELAAAGAPVPSTAPDRTRLYFDEQHGVHWVRGRSFKARAAADGFTYVPFLGSDASQNWPVRFRLASTSIGGTELTLAADANVDLRGSEFTLDRGPVDVEYEVALDGVEQLFHIERKGLSGEIVVTLDVETELFGAPSGGGLRFDGPEGGVDYGAAIAFDASGATVEVPVQFDTGKLRLTVPAAFVDAAAGDITIDPLLTSFAVDTVSEDQSDVDTTYTSGTDAFIFVYEDKFSSADTDIYLTSLDSTGVGVGQGYIEIGSAVWVDPEIAQLSGDDVALIVATEEVSGGDDPIQGRLWDTANSAVSGSSFIVGSLSSSTTLTWTNARPDVGGSRSFFAGERFFVCWQRTLSSGGTFARYTTVDAAGNVSFIRAMGPTAPESRVSEVRVSESAGDVSAVNVWNVCFKNDTALAPAELWAGQYNPDGTVASFVANVQSTSLVNPTDLDISDGLALDGLDPTYVIVYDNFVFGDEDVTALVCRNSTLIGVTDVTMREHAIESRNQDLPRVAATVDRFVVGYIEDSGGVATTYSTTLDLIEGNSLAIA